MLCSWAPSIKRSFFKTVLVFVLGTLFVYKGRDKFDKNQFIKLIREMGRGGRSSRRHIFAAIIENIFLYRVGTAEYVQIISEAVKKISIFVLYRRKFVK